MSESQTMPTQFSKSGSRMTLTLRSRQGDSRNSHSPAAQHMRRMTPQMLNDIVVADSTPNLLWHTRASCVCMHSWYGTTSTLTMRVKTPQYRRNPLGRAMSCSGSSRPTSYSRQLFSHGLSKSSKRHPHHHHISLETYHSPRTPADAAQRVQSSTKGQPQIGAATEWEKGA